MHVRLQTWLPLTIQVCMNGREWLAKAMDRAGCRYERHGNCFTRIDDLGQRRWMKTLNALARRVNIWLAPSAHWDLHGYYWTMREAEFATDVMFHDAPTLQQRYPQLLRHALENFGSEQVLRSLGRRTVDVHFNGDVDTRLTRRVEGTCIKHRVEENSIKMYDNHGSILRIETTINNPRRYKVYPTAGRQGRHVKALSTSPGSSKSVEPPMIAT